MIDQLQWDRFCLASCVFSLLLSVCVFVYTFSVCALRGMAVCQTIPKWPGRKKRVKRPNLKRGKMRRAGGQLCDGEKGQKCWQGSETVG